MIKQVPQFLILTGDGVNCEVETLKAFEQEQMAGKIVHLSELLKDSSLMNQFQGLVLPGGFSFGDELGSGQILSLKLKHFLGDAFREFIHRKKPIIGICNGFQVLTKLNLLPCEGEDKTVALAANDHGQFIDRWVKLDVNNKNSPWTNSILKDEIFLPIRHGEGRLVLKQGQESDIYQSLQKNRQIPLSYQEDVNGSYKKIAALTSQDGLVLGMMPHPEAACSSYTSPLVNRFLDGKADGSLLFKSIYQYISQS